MEGRKLEIFLSIRHIGENPSRLEGYLASGVVEWTLTEFKKRYE